MPIVRRRLLRSLLLLAPVAASALLLAASPGAGRTTFSTRVSISDIYPAFHGALHSKSRFCTAERPVRLYRERPGRDTLLGSTRSTASGTWKVGVRILTSGTYYVKAPLYGSASLGIDCRAGRSRLVTLD